MVPPSESWRASWAVVKLGFRWNHHSNVPMVESNTIERSLPYHFSEIISIIVVKGLNMKILFISFDIFLFLNFRNNK